MSDEIQIDRGIPLPPRGRITKYPWAKMEVGDSFLFPSKGAGPAAAAAKSACVRNAPKKFVHGKHNNQYRIWRTE